MDKEMQKHLQECKDTSDCTEISREYGLYVKPIAKLNITVTLPKMKSGQAISNWEIIEKLTAAIQPQKFTSIKPTDSTTLKFIKFEAEIESKKTIGYVVSRIDKKGIKLSGLSELLKIHAVEAKIPFPSRNDWDSFFRDAKHMNEMKPGERPDTIHLQDLPCRWFASNMDNTKQASIAVLEKVFKTFGEIRISDIPYLDPYRKNMTQSISGIKNATFNHEKDNVLFDAFIQFKEYIGFTKCMHEFQGKKLVLVRGKEAFSASIKIDFDKTKQLSDQSIRKRDCEREKLMISEREKTDKLKREHGLAQLREQNQQSSSKFVPIVNKNEEKRKNKKAKQLRRKQRESKRRLKKLQSHNPLDKNSANNDDKMSKRIALEERKLLIAQRKLETIRLLDTLFNRIKVNHKREVMTIRAMQENTQESPVKKVTESEIMRTVDTKEWFNDECAAAKKLIKYHKSRCNKNPNDGIAKNMMNKAKEKYEAAVKKAKKEFLDKKQKEEEGDSNDMVSKEKKLREKLINSLKLQQQQAMEHQQMKVEKVIQEEIAEDNRTDENSDEDPILSDSESTISTLYDSLRDSSPLSSSEPEEEIQSNLPSDPKNNNPNLMPPMMNFPPPGFFPNGPPNAFPPFGGGPNMPPFMNPSFMYPPPGGPNPMFNRFRGPPPSGFFNGRGAMPNQMNRGRGFMRGGRMMYNNRGRGQTKEQEKAKIEKAKPKPKWFKREDKKRHRSWSASRSRSRSRSSDDSRRWTTSSSRSRSRSRSRRRSKSRSNSRSRSKSRSRSVKRSKSRSRSRSKSRSRSRNKSKSRSRSHSKSRSRSRKSKSRGRSHSKSGSRSRKESESRNKSVSKSRSNSRRKSVSRSRSRSRSRTRRSSHSKSRSGSRDNSKSRSTSRGRSRRHKRSKNKKKSSDSKKEKDDSDPELSSEEKISHDNFNEEENEFQQGFNNFNNMPYNQNYNNNFNPNFQPFQNNFRGRGNFNNYNNRFQNFQNNWRGRGNQFRNNRGGFWRGNQFNQNQHFNNYNNRGGRGWINKNKQDYNHSSQQKYEDKKDPEFSEEYDSDDKERDEYHQMYRKYFTSVVEKEEKNRERDCRNSGREPSPIKSDKKPNRKRDRSSSHESRRFAEEKMYKRSKTSKQDKNEYSDEERTPSKRKRDSSYQKDRYEEEKDYTPQKRARKESRYSMSEEEDDRKLYSDRQYDNSGDLHNRLSGGRQPWGRGGRNYRGRNFYDNRRNFRQRGSFSRDNNYPKDRRDSYNRDDSYQRDRDDSYHRDRDDSYQKDRHDSYRNRKDSYDKDDSYADREDDGYDRKKYKKRERSYSSSPAVEEVKKMKSKRPKAIIDLTSDTEATNRRKSSNKYSDHSSDNDLEYGPRKKDFINAKKKEKEDKLKGNAVDMESRYRDEEDKYGDKVESSRTSSKQKRQIRKRVDESD